MRNPTEALLNYEALLAYEAAQGRKFELIDGRPRAMAGSTLAHGFATGNAYASLHRQLRGKPCRPYPADVHIKIPNGNVRYPDLSVDCGPLRNKDRAAVRPVLVVEVLSPSTPWHEHAAKLRDYQSVETLLYIVLVEQSRRFAQVWTRFDGDWRLNEYHGPNAVLEFPEIEALLTFDDIYEGIDFDTDDDADDA